MSQDISVEFVVLLGSTPGATHSAGCRSKFQCQVFLMVRNCHLG